MKIYIVFLLILFIQATVFYKSLAQDDGRPPDGYYVPEIMTLENSTEPPSEAQVESFNFFDPLNPIVKLGQLGITQSGCIGVCLVGGNNLTPHQTLVGIYVPIGACPGTPVLTYFSSPLTGTCCCY